MDVPDRWTRMEQTLSEQRVIPSHIDVEQVYTLSFLEFIYGK